MIDAKRKARTERVRKMNRVLKKLYPNPKVALHHSTEWELLVAVILSAQCTDKRVNQVTKSLFKRYATIEDYAFANKAEFEKLIFSCGFYRSKTKSIIASAKRIVEVYKGRVPQTMEELLTLPGVARKTANVILSNLFGVHVGIAVDTHVRRFAIRFDLTDHSDPVRIERDLMAIMPKSEWWQFNHRLVHYGRDVCPAGRHDCNAHPLTRIYPKAKDIWPSAR